MMHIQKWPAAMLFGLAILLVYGNSLRGPFVLDDVEAIQENPALRQVWPLTTALNPPPVEMSFYSRPFVHLTMCLNYASGGLNPWSYRVTNLGLHWAAACLLFLLLGKALTASGTKEPQASVLAFGSVLIWAVHPLATNAVNYLTQRGELLVGLFLFLLLYAVHRTSEKAQAGLPSRGWPLLAILACLLGMGSKECMAAAPILAMAYDRIFLAPSWKEILRRRGWMYLLLAATWAWPVSRHLAYSPHVPQAGFSTTSIWTYPLAQAWGLTRMIGLAVWPHPLIFDYGTVVPSHFSWVFGQILLVLGLVLFTLWALKTHPRAGFLGLCFFGLLGASSSFFPIIGQPVAEHRMYAPLAALVTAAVLALQAFLQTLRFQDAATVNRRMIGVVLVWAVALGAASHQRNKTYQSALTLWADTVAKRPQNGRAWINLGLALNEAGKFEDSLSICRRAVELEPQRVQSHNNLGNALYALGRYEEALESYTEAVRTDPSYAPARSNQGNAFSRLGRYEESLAAHERALRASPGTAEIQYNMAHVLSRMNRHAEACGYYRAAVRLNPAYPAAWQGLANSLFESGQTNEAIATYGTLLEAHPDDFPAIAGLGLLYIRAGQKAQAMELFVRSAQRTPHPADNLNSLASGLITQGFPAEGLELSERALKLQPSHPLALNNAAWILATSTNQSLRDGQRALKYATRSVQMLGNQHPSAWATLAAAQAEAGQWEEAAATAQTALRLAREQGQTNLVAMYEVRLLQYQREQPWRE